MSTNPSNAELLEAFKDHAKDDHEFQVRAQAIHEEIQQSLAKIERKLDADPSNEDFILRPINEKLDPVVRAYDGFLFSKSFLLGLASVVVAIGAIGAGILSLIEAATHK